MLGLFIKAKLTHKYLYGYVLKVTRNWKLTSIMKKVAKAYFDNVALIILKWL